MMGVDIEVDHPLPFLNEPPYPDHRIIDVTESRSPRSLSMVKASGDAESNVSLPLTHEIDRLKGCADNPQRPIVETFEDRIISRTQTILIEPLIAMPFTRLFQHVKIFPAVKKGQILLVRLPGGNTIEPMEGIRVRRP